MVPRSALGSASWTPQLPTAGNCGHPPFIEPAQFGKRFGSGVCFIAPDSPSAPRAFRMAEESFRQGASYVIKRRVARYSNLASIRRTGAEGTMEALRGAGGDAARFDQGSRRTELRHRTSEGARTGV